MTTITVRNNLAYANSDNKPLSTRELDAIIRAKALLAYKTLTKIAWWELSATQAEEFVLGKITGVEDARLQRLIAAYAMKILAYTQ